MQHRRTHSRATARSTWKLVLRSLKRHANRIGNLLILIMKVDEGLDEVVLKKLALCSKKQPELTSWNTFLQKHKNPKSTVEIGLIGKYVELHDSYKSYKILAHGTVRGI